MFKNEYDIFWCPESQQFPDRAIVPFFANAQLRHPTVAGRSTNEARRTRGPTVIAGRSTSVARRLMLRPLRWLITLWSHLHD